MFPIISEFNTTETFGYLWLKYVTGFDLSVHCAKCLRGEYSTQLSADTKHEQFIALNEHTCQYYYLCGVTKPYLWRKNLHIAFRYKKGSCIEYNDGETQVTIVDAERIPIKNLGDYGLERNGNKPAYCTCRNWRFAYQMTYDYATKTLG